MQKTSDSEKEQLLKDYEEWLFRYQQKKFYWELEFERAFDFGLSKCDILRVVNSEIAPGDPEKLRDAYWEYVDAWVDLVSAQAKLGIPCPLPDLNTIPNQGDK